jgi:O-antigen ligase
MAKRPKKNKIGVICLEIIRSLSYLILFTPLILSSNFFFPFVGPKSLFFMGLVEIVFFSWLILILIDSNYRPKFNFLLLSLIIYLFIFILASILGVNPSYSFWSKYERMTGILMQLHLFGFFLVLSSVFKEDDFKKIFGFSVFVAILASLIALANLKNPTMRGGGTIGNESFLGTYLIFNLFFALYLVFKTQDLSRKLSLTGFLILTLSIFLIGVNLENLSFSKKISAILYGAGARAAKLSFLGGLVLFFFFWLISSQKKGLKILGLFLLISSFILAGYLIFSAFQPGSFVRKFVEKEIGTFGGRFIVWQGAKKGFLERKWLGWGPENFEFSFTKYYDPCMPTSRCGGEVWYDRAHNIIFDNLISTGILGMVSYLLIFATSFYILWKNFLKKKIDFWPAGIFTSLFIAYFVQNLTVFDMVSSYMVFFLSLAFIASFEKEREIGEISEPKKIILALILICFLISFTEFIILPTMTDVLVISAIRAPPFSEKRISLYQKSLSFSHLGKFQIREFFTEVTIDSFYSTTTLNENAFKELDFLAQELKKSIAECPINFRSYLKLGQVLNLYSQFDNTKIKEAEDILKKAIELSPKNQQGYWQLAQNMLYQGNFDEAIYLAQKAVDLEPNLERSHQILILVAKMAGKKDLAKEKLEEAIRINPDWEKDLKPILEGA